MRKRDRKIRKRKKTRQTDIQEKGERRRKLNNLSIIIGEKRKRRGLK
jgi:hypothetical protein